MDGIFLIDKEINYTSRDIVNIIGKKFKTKKVGHAGTLDPFATGLLIVTFNKGTKITQFLESCTKIYVASLKLGFDTDTLDLNGNKIAEKENPLLEKKEIEEVLNSFLGKYVQEIPKYSAVKFKGKELYKYARMNIEIPQLNREIDIQSIKLIDFEDDVITFEVVCSKGTYIRQLGQDIAHKLNACGHLVALRRIRIGSFSIGDSKKINEISDSDLISISKSLSHMTTIKVDVKLEEDIKNGKKVKLDSNEEEILIINTRNEPIAVLEYDEVGVYKVKRGLF